MTDATPPCRKVVQHRERLAALRARYTFDDEAADRAVRFIERNLLHWKEPFAGQPFVLSPWQRDDIVRPLFGFVRDDGARLFREAYIQLPRKNGKSALAAAILLYILFLDGEGLELYTAATKREQASIVFNDAVSFIQRSPRLARRAAIYKTHVWLPKTRSRLAPLSADYNSMDGLNVSAASIDELHAHPSAHVHDVIVTATGARRQPLVLKITTAGEHAEGLCRDQYQLAERILEEAHEADSYFAYVAEADKAIEWDDPRAYEQANPNLGVSISRDYLEDHRRRAVELPSYRRTFERYHLNRWTQAGADKWLPLERWRAAREEFTAAGLVGQECYAGFDLASTTDLTSLAIVYPQAGGVVRLLNWYWLPEARLVERARLDRVPYDVWRDEGWLETTPGDVLDQDALTAQLATILRLHRPKLVAYDDWNMVAINQRLEREGFTLVKFVQGLRSFHPPSQELERLLLAGLLRHNGNPVTAWCAANVEVARDPSGKMRPMKSHKSSRERIDGIVAAIMALDALLRRRPNTLNYAAIPLDLRRQLGV